MISEKRTSKGRLALFENNQLISRECGTCTEMKPVTEFHKSKTGFCGLVSQCKHCVYLQHNKNIKGTRVDGKILLNESGDLISRNCTQCLENKPADQFHKSSSAAGGRAVVCKSCCNVNSIQHYAENKEEIGKKNAAAYKANPQPAKDRAEKYRNGPKREQILERKRQEGKARYEDVEWVEATREPRRLQTKEWRDKNPEHIKAYNKKYKSENADLCIAISTERINRKRVQEDFSQNFRKDTQGWFKYVRQLNKQFGKKAFAVDHIIPLKHPDVCGLHYPQNFQILTRSQNSSKRSDFDGTRENLTWKTKNDKKE